VTEDVSLLSQPHHDGSSLYVSSLSPRLGDTVTVRVRVPHEADVTSVHVRTKPDEEPKFVDAVVERRTATETWWAAKLLCHNPVTSYRFILQGGPSGYQWLNGTGVHLRDVPDAADFRIVTYDEPPRWARDAIVYQIFPDRFAKSTNRPQPEWAIPAEWDEPVNVVHGPGARQLYGGDLDGIIQHLDHIQNLGATVIYLTPFFPARSNHRYDATSFDAVDPLLGGGESLHRLVVAAHERGLRVIGDFTTNHTGIAHKWFEKARRDPASEERSFYFIEGEGADVSYVTWLNTPTLPKLNYDSPALWRRVFEDDDGVVRRWLSGEHGLDGWRVDVANMTGRHRDQDHNHEVARAMRAAMHEARPDSLLVAEHCHDYTKDALGDGWHGVMNYVGFTRPLWTWLRDKGYAPKFLGAPLMVPRLGAASVMETIREFTAMVPWRTVVHSFNLLGSHDTTRIRTLVGADSRQVDVAAGLLMTMPGIPMVTYGDEIGMLGDFGEDGRRPMPWGGDDWDRRLHAVYRDLFAVRTSLDALRHGGLRWVHAGGDALVFLRETTEQVVLVHAARAAHGPVAVPARHLPGVEGATTAYGRPLVRADDMISLAADEPEINIWVYPSSTA
jgi:alpha-glucosidase